MPCLITPQARLALGIVLANLQLKAAGLQKEVAQQRKTIKKLKRRLAEAEQEIETLREEQAYQAAGESW